MQDIKISFLHICEYAFFSDDKKLNVLGVFQNINVTDIPATYPRFFLVVGFSGNVRGCNVSIKIESPLQKTVVETSKVFNEMDPSKKTSNIVINLIGVSFHELGKHKIKISVNNSSIDEDNYFLEVKKS